MPARPFERALTAAFIIFCGVACMGAAAAKEEGPKENRQDDKTFWGTFWVMPERDLVFSPDRVVGALDIKPGDKVADIGSGAGYFTFRLARAVGPLGIVYALECYPGKEIMETFNARMKDSALNPYGNVKFIQNKDSDCMLPPESVDKAFMCLDGILLVDLKDVTLPGFKWRRDKQEQTMKSVYNAMKKNGRLAVIDVIYDPAIPYPAVNSSEMLEGGVIAAKDLDVVKRNYERIGFRFVKSLDMFNNKEYDKVLKVFVASKMYSRMNAKMRYFMGRHMFFFIFEKP